MTPHPRQVPLARHAFNLSFYKSKWRLMDYGPMSTYLHHFEGRMESVTNLWNDQEGHYWCLSPCNSIMPRRRVSNYWSYDNGGVACPAGRLGGQARPPESGTFVPFVCNYFDAPLQDPLPIRKHFEDTYGNDAAICAEPCP